MKISSSITNLTEQKKRYYFTLCTYKKTCLFLFSINVFGVYIPNLQSIFFRPALENPDNPENTKFSGLSRFSGVGLKKLIADL